LHKAQIPIMLFLPSFIVIPRIAYWEAARACPAAAVRNHKALLKAFCDSRYIARFPFRPVFWLRYLPSEGALLLCWLPGVQEAALIAGHPVERISEPTTGTSSSSPILDFQFQEKKGRQKRGQATVLVVSQCCGGRFLVGRGGGGEKGQEPFSRCFFGRRRWRREAAVGVWPWVWHGCLPVRRRRSQRDACGASLRDRCVQWLL